MKIKLETLVFSLHLWHFGVHGLLQSVYPSVVHPVIRRPEEPAPDPVIGLSSPGALENLPGVSRTLSSVAVTGEPGPGSGPNTSWASLSDIRYGHSSGASSTSIGCCRRLSTAEANSDSDRAYQKGPGCRAGPRWSREAQVRSLEHSLLEVPFPSLLDRGFQRVL